MTVDGISLPQSFVGRVRSTGACTAQANGLIQAISLFGLLAILAVQSAIACTFVHLLEKQLLLRDAEATRAFIESIIETERRTGSGEPASINLPQCILDKVVGHLPRLPDAVRVNLYSADAALMWSSDARFATQRSGPNAELQRALEGNIQVASATVTVNGQKAEHIGLTEQADPVASIRFVEAYLPIRDALENRVFAVVEIYTLPRRLFQTIDSGRRLVWAGAGLGGCVLYALLLCIVRRAGRIIDRQQQQIVGSAALSAVGDVAAAVGQNFRNSLAGIRFAAEQIVYARGDDANRHVSEIARQAGYLESWVCELLATAPGVADGGETVDLNALLLECIETVAEDIERNQIRLGINVAPVPAFRGGRLPLAHAVRGILENAIEAMPSGGTLCIECGLVGSEEVRVSIQDSCSEVPADGAGRASRQSSKPHRTGLGLTLCRSIVERYCGSICIFGSEGGTRVVITLPVRD